jgi:type IV pilus assembly protein PilN
MARINLLPWRQWERERKQRQFLANLGLVLVAGVGCVLFGGWMLQSDLDGQNQLNSQLESKIADLDEKIKEISDLESEREELLARMRVIQELQGNRPVIVRVFDEVSRTLSRGVHFTQLNMRDKQLAVTGVAESNNRISGLMRNLDGSDWFTGPNLKSIKEDPENRDYGDQASRFELTFLQSNPNAPAEDS